MIEKEIGMSDFDLLDSEEQTVGEFVVQARLELDLFATNMEHLNNFRGRKLTQFEWYFYFGRWNDSLKFLDKIEEKLAKRFATKETKENGKTPL